MPHAIASFPDQNFYTCLCVGTNLSAGRHPGCASCALINRSALTRDIIIHAPLQACMYVCLLTTNKKVQVPKVSNTMGLIQIPRFTVRYVHRSHMGGSPLIKGVKPNLRYHRDQGLMILTKISQYLRFFVCYM